MEENNYHVAVFVARVFLGLLFLFQGYDKVFRIRMHEVIRTFKVELPHPGFPGWIVTLSAYYTSYVELLGGLCLVLGLMKYYALYALGLDLLLVAVAMGVTEPMWKTDFVFPRLVLLLLLLLLPAGYDTLSLDFLLRR